MQSLGSRQVPSPDLTLSLDPSAQPRPADSIQMNNLDRSIATSTSTSTRTSITTASLATKKSPSPLTQLSATDSIGMATTKMAENSTPRPVVEEEVQQSGTPTGETQSNMSPIDSTTTTATPTATATATATGTTREEKGKGVAPASPTPPSKSDSGTIGPAIDDTSALSSTLSTAEDPANPYCLITLLLTSGARHGYKVDERYLTKRNTTIPGVTETGKKDPYSISVYTLKELILREWREEWDAKPTSPSSIRLIYFGRLLKDNMPLEECKFNKTAKNVVHMTVRPQDIVDEEEEERKRAEGRQREEHEPTARCGCVIL